MKIKKTTGPWTVWDTGFHFIVAPAEPDGHPHPNVALQVSAVKSFCTGNIMTDRQLRAQFKKAWNYANKLNAEAKAEVR